jgi:molecular chaperone DnaK
MGYQLGIDLGTTYTAAAVSRATEQQHADPEMVSLGDRAVQIPSVVYLAPDGSLLVGEAAERRALTDPDRVVREFKRQVGDETPLVVGGTPYPAHDLVAMTVAWVVERVAEREGGPARRIALTHPASWGGHKKDLLSRALAARGLAVTFLAEPQAAALSYAAAERVERGSTIAVYDLGGGTFDSAVVRKNGTFTVLGHPEGIDRLGGVDFDDAVFAHVRDAIGDTFDALDPADEAAISAVARLRRECVEAKEALSSDTEARIAVLLPGLQTAVRLTRGEFERMIRPQLEESVEALHRAVVSAGLLPADLTAVLLVGGSSRIPLVSQLVSAAFDRPVAVDADPKNAIALGAALSISPRAESWPATSIPPVAAGGAVAAGAAMAHGAADTPIRPVGRPKHRLPEPEPTRPAHRLPTPAPAAALDQPPQTVSARPRRPVGLMFGAGGLFVAAAMAAALLFSPDRGTPGPTGETATTVIEVPQVNTSEIPVPTDGAPDRSGQEPANQGGRGPEAPPPNQGGAAPPPAPAPVEQTTREQPPPTTPPPTTTTTTTTTTTPTTTTTSTEPTEPTTSDNPQSNPGQQPEDPDPQTGGGAESDTSTGTGGGETEGETGDSAPAGTPSG